MEAQLTEFYNQGWEVWDDFVKNYPASIHRRAYILNQIAKIPEWKSAADFGCGNAILIYKIFERFQKEGRNFAGFDISNEQVEKNKNYFPDISFGALDFSTASPSEKFDVITCSEVIEHIDDYKAAIKNLSDSLNPGGTCIITVPTGTIYDTDRYFGHVKHFEKEEFIELFAEAGVDCISCKSWGFPFHDLAKKIVNMNSEKSINKYIVNKLSWPSKILFKITTFVYCFNFLPMGTQLYFVGRKN